MSFRKLLRASLRIALASSMLAIVASTARADLSFDSVGVGATGLDGSFARQAAAHPDLNVRFQFGTKIAVDGTSVVPDGQVRDVNVTLPPGLVGNPTAAPTCTVAQLGISAGSSDCPVASEVGWAKVIIKAGATFAGNDFLSQPIYNLAHGDDVPALFGFKYLNAVVLITPHVEPGSYVISAATVGLTQAVPTFAADIALWGIPADPSHDALRGGPSPDVRKPFLTAATSCSGAPSPVAITADSWEQPNVKVSATLSSDFDGIPFITEGCEHVPFSPSISVQPLSHVADAPTGLAIDVAVPQSDSPDGLASAQVRKTVVRFPAGVSVSPSAAAGLGACSLAQVGLGTNDMPSCPGSSKIGTVEIDTPLLADPLKGDVILASQNDNPFGSLLALYLVAQGPGFVVKLPGRVDADPVTGQLTTTFDNTPQLPFDRLHVVIRGGSQAPLATPTSCGTYMTHTEITSWASESPVELDSPMTIDQGCTTLAFAPVLSAGSASTLAGARSPFSLTLTRTDGQPYLSGVSATLPPGLLAYIADVPQCAEVQAAAGTCSAASQIGHTSARSGPGSAPLALTGTVSLTGPYGGGPFGLSIVVPTAGQAGPYDLGDVVVRAGIFIDPVDGHATVKTDPLPTIIDGFPLRLRQVGVSIDRANFTVNPTNCDKQQVSVLATAVGGASASPSVLFQVGGCGALPLAPKLALTLSGKGQTTDGKHPGVHAVVTQTPGQANLKKVQVALPLSLALDPDNAQALCEFTDGSKIDPACPKASIVGKAVARTPILDQPLTGPVYFVKNVRKDPKSGRDIRTLPKLVIPLTGENGVRLNLVGTSNVVGNRLVTTFDNIPDAPVSDFTLDIDGGKSGILVVSGTDICKATQIADQQVDGQNAKVIDSAIYIQTPSCALKVLSKKTTKTSVSVKVAGLGAGKVTVTGHGIKKTTKTISKSTVATITAKRTKGKPGKVTVSFDPTGPAKAHKTTK
jgi:hypothetical protein